MNSEEAFDHILSSLRAANDLGIRPLIRLSGTDWVCTIEDKQTKFIIIAKEEEFMLVSMKSKKSPPDVQRIHDPAYIQQNAIQRIQEIIADVYGDLATK